MHCDRQKGSEPDHVAVFSGFAAKLVGAMDAFLFPPACQMCGKDVPRAPVLVCDPCWGELGYISDAGCPRCGCPGVQNVAKCDNCSSKDFEFSRLITAYSFEEGIQRLLHDLKYRGRTSVVSTLANGLVRRLEGLDIPTSRSIAGSCSAAQQPRTRAWIQPECADRPCAFKGRVWAIGFEDGCAESCDLDPDCPGSRCPKEQCRGGVCTQARCGG